MLLDLFFQRRVLLGEPLHLPIEFIELAVELVEVVLLLLTHFFDFEALGFIDRLHLGDLQLQVVAVALRLVSHGDCFVPFLLHLLEFALGLGQLLHYINLIKLLCLNIDELIIPRCDQLLLSLILPVELFRFLLYFLDDEVLLGEFDDLLVL